MPSAAATVAAGPAWRSVDRVDRAEIGDLVAEHHPGGHGSCLLETGHAR